MNVRIGYKASAEQFAPRELLEFSVEAEHRGLDIVAVSDHLQPGRHHGGHAPSAFTWLGAVGQATSRAALATSVLTPTLRYHPSIVAQALGALDPAAVVDAIAPHLDLGFTDQVLHGPGGNQRRFLEQFTTDVLPGLRERAEQPSLITTGSTA